ncbi:DUF3889 domain-containing protein [Paenibacillus sp. MMS20-IR301]|uniref:DUF3889 domain-containing protein n=1 Tax=Paenibacillus sp. MMS20-IR301 TaxID=2895946 RepID=UPI0028EFB460|nr:DUF3889 domain-containing protein [Paenibacillus sp. MMS20-IR301]WNS42964.1 DUF3889 domain-containing protein [Paenibacillus sp. MMS20-IR301]
MKRSPVIALLVLFFVLNSPLSSAAPDYAKWGIVAVKATQQRYDADIVDYKHIGRTQIQPGLAEEKFRLWVRSRSGQEFGVIVRIRFDPSADQLKSILFTETNRRR